MAWMDLSRVEQRLQTRFIGRNLVYCTSVGSTQDVARQEGERGAPEGTAILSEEQTAGRGRLGRLWVSPAGKNIYVTLLVRPPLERLRSLSIIAALAVAEATEETAAVSPRIKWPNDVLVGGRKLAGVLIETELAGADVRYALVGIGVNVNLDVELVPEIAAIATSLKRELGREVSREDVVAALFNRFEALYLAAQEGQRVHVAWRARLETLGRPVRVRFGEQVEEGTAEDVDAQGGLILRRADGSRVTIEAGEVTLRE